MQMLFMERFSIKPLTFSVNWGHDVLLDTAHDLFGFKS